MTVMVSGKLLGVSFLLHSWVRKLNSGHQLWKQVSLPEESISPVNLNLRLKPDFSVPEGSNLLIARATLAITSLKCNYNLIIVLSSKSLGLISIHFFKKVYKHLLHNILESHYNHKKEIVIEGVCHVQLIAAVGWEWWHRPI